jgi:hypothetical protein
MYDPKIYLFKLIRQSQYKQTDKKPAKMEHCNTKVSRVNKLSRKIISQSKINTQYYEK